MDNTTFKIYSDRPVRQGNITVLNSQYDPVHDSRYPDVDYEVNVSGQFVDFPQPKLPQDEVGQFDADDGNLPSSSPASLISRNDFDLLAFDDSSIETCYFDGVVSDNYRGGNLDVNLNWTSNTATSGNVLWRCSLSKLDNEENILTHSFANSNSGTAQAPSASGDVVNSTIQMTTTNLDSLRRSDTYRLKVDRVGDNSLDTMTGDAQLLTVQIREI